MTHLTMSDFHHNVINALVFHSRLNLTGDTDQQPSSELLERCLDEGPPARFTEDTVTGARVDIPGHRLSIQQLDWRYYSPEDLPRVDVIVASDIIFAKELHDSLSSLLVDLLKVCSSPNPEAFIACTVRSDGMVQGFLKVQIFLKKSTILSDCQKHLYLKLSQNVFLVESREQRINCRHCLREELQSR